MSTKLGILGLIFIFINIVIIEGEYIPPGPTYRCPKNNLYLYPCNCTEPGDRGITVICQNANLASISVGLKNLADQKIPIEKLEISRCNILGKYKFYNNLPEYLLL